MGTINYKDPSLLSSQLANGEMSAADKVKLDGLGAVLDGYSAALEMVEAVDNEILLAIDGYATIGYVNSRTPATHASTHEAGGSDPVDGYFIELSYLPVNYAPPIDGYIGEHIARIDTRLGQAAPSPYIAVSFDIDLTTTANTLIDTRTSSPSGSGRWKLISIDLRVKTAITGGGSPSSAISIGSTSGGQQIVVSQTIIPSVAVGSIVGGFALTSLGSDMSQSTGFEAIYPASQAIFANVTETNSPTTGAVTVYIIWQSLP